MSPPRVFLDKVVHGKRSLPAVGPGARTNQRTKVPAVSTLVEEPACSCGKAQETGTRRAIVALPHTQAGPRKENPTMAKKRRTHAQIAATYKMLKARNPEAAAKFARKHKLSGGGGGKKSAAKKSPAKKAARKPATRKTATRKPATRKTAARKSTTRKTTGKGAAVSRSISSRTRTLGRKKALVPGTYRNKRTGSRLIVTKNPRLGKLGLYTVGGVGLLAGMGGGIVLDRWYATRAVAKWEKDATKNPNKQPATALYSVRQQYKHDAAQFAIQGAGVAIGLGGAYLVRRKSTLAAYLLGGAGLGFLANMLTFAMVDYVLPWMFKTSNAAEIKMGNRLFPNQQTWFFEGTKKNYNEVQLPAYPGITGADLKRPYRPVGVVAGPPRQAALPPQQSRYEPERVNAPEPQHVEQPNGQPRVESAPNMDVENLVARMAAV